MENLWKALNRRKQLTSNDDKDSQLARVMNLFDLVALSVGSTLGIGVYVLAGSVAYNHAGPAVLVSFLLAAIASSLAAFCYAGEIYQTRLYLPKISGNQKSLSFLQLCV